MERREQKMRGEEKKEQNGEERLKGEMSKRKEENGREDN